MVDGISDSMDMNLSKIQETVKDRGVRHGAVHGGHKKLDRTARRSSQSILKEINPSLEGLLLKLQYFGHLMERANSLEKALMLETIEGRRRRGQWLDGITNSMDRSLSEFRERVKDREAYHATVHRVTKHWTHLSD